MRLNPEKAESDWPCCIVAGAYQTGVVLMRALHRRGVRVFGVDHRPEMPGFKTRYADVRLCPNPDVEPHRWVAFMFDLSREIGGQPVLISSADQYVTAIATHGGKIEARFQFCKTSMATQALLATKERQYSIADENGLPAPHTRFLQSIEDANAFAREARFPCLLKPLHCREWKRDPAHPLFDQKVVIAKTADELRRHYLSASSMSPEMMAQEIIEGPDTAKLVYLSCYGQSGERIGTAMVREIRTTPIYFGSASVVEPVTDPEADRLCNHFLSSLGFWGLCEIELKRDMRDGQVKMIEANPRFSVTADAAYYAGVELGWLHYLDLIGQKVTPVEPSSRNFRHIVLTRDFDTIRSYRQRKLLTWWELIRSYRPPVYFFDFDMFDPLLTARNVLEWMRLLIRPLARKSFLRKNLRRSRRPLPL
jgi:predicted ATP-grasp superfamily ATP-dependent carboligase